MDLARTQEECERRARRVAITLVDAMETVEFAHELLQEATANSEKPDSVVERALTLATIVSYARPYTKTWKSQDTDGSVSQDFLVQVSSTDRATHDKVMTMRDKTFAHSDAAYARVVFDTRPCVLATAHHTPSRVRLVQEEIEAIRELARRLMGWCIEESSRLGFPSVSAQSARKFQSDEL